MMEVTILRLARDDLREIREYLSELGEGPAKKFRASFEKFNGQVAEMPYMFSHYECNPVYRRAVLAYDYLVFYRVDEDKEIVKVYRVLHGKRLINPLLG